MAKLQKFLEKYCSPPTSGDWYYPKVEYVLLYEGNRVSYFYEGKMWVETIHDMYDSWTVWDDDDAILLDKIDIYKLHRPAK